MDGFLTWDVLLTFSGLVSVVYMVVEFTKGLPLIKKIQTRYWSFIVSLILIMSTNAVMGTFKPVDVLLYSLTAMSISLGSNGLSNFNKKPESTIDNLIEEKEEDDNE